MEGCLHFSRVVLEPRDGANRFPISTIGVDLAPGRQS